MNTHHYHTFSHKLFENNWNDCDIFIKFIAEYNYIWLTFYVKANK